MANHFHQASLAEAGTIKHALTMAGTNTGLLWAYLCKEATSAHVTKGLTQQPYSIWELASYSQIKAFTQKPDFIFILLLLCYLLPPLQPCCPEIIRQARTSGPLHLLLTVPLPPNPRPATPLEMLFCRCLRGSFPHLPQVFAQMSLSSETFSHHLQ